MKGSKFSRVRAAENAGISITSLMDVLTIILIFLLVNYSDNSSEAEVPKDISIPKLNTKKTLNFKEDIVVQIGENKIEINNSPIVFRAFQVEKDRVISEARTVLGGIQAAREPAKQAESRISIKADENVDYEKIDSLLLAAAAVGITNIDLVALAKQ